MCVCACVYLIIEDDHDKHTKEHRLHQEDDVVSTEKKRENTRVEIVEVECK